MKKYKKIILVLAIVIVIAITTIFTVIKIVKNDSTGNTIGNIREYGYVAEDNNYIYFMSPDNDGVSKARFTNLSTSSQFHSTLTLFALAL